jgi:lysophosphatidylcholine acyltransferase/lyso-PAF acetyltransferase
MECELKDLSPTQGEANPQPPQPPQRCDSAHDEGSTKDDRPLLKPEPASQAAPVSRESLQELEKKFAAYVRHDVYGPMGRGELPLEEKVLLGIALVTLVPIRVAAAMTILLLYYAICKVCTLFSSPNREEGDQEDYAHLGGWRRKVIVQCGRALSRAMLFVFGFYWISQKYRIPNSHDKSSTVQVAIPILSL